MLDTKITDLTDSLAEQLENKQPLLTAGDNISISGNVISAKISSLIKSTSANLCSGATTGSFHGFVDIVVGTKTLRVSWGKLANHTGNTNGVSISFGFTFKTIYSVTAVAEQTGSSYDLTDNGNSVYSVGNSGFTYVLDGDLNCHFRYIADGEV
jgi:hypothetical protein